MWQGCRRTEDTLKRLVKFLDSIALYVSGVLANVVLASLTLLVTLEVILRKIFGTSTLLADEYSGYLFVALLFLGASYTMYKKRHISIDVISNKLRPKPKLLLERILISLNILVFGILVWRGIDLVVFNFQHNILAATVTATPQFIPMIVIPVGLLLLILQSIAELIRTFLPSSEVNKDRQTS